MACVVVLNGGNNCLDKFKKYQKVPTANVKEMYTVDNDYSTINYTQKCFNSIVA